MISMAGEPVRLLPWTTPEGAPCYLLGGGDGYLSRKADDVERAQLDLAVELLDHAADMLADDEKVTPVQLRYLTARMAESLHNVHRIAESRGARIAAPGAGGQDEQNEQDEQDGHGGQAG